jgi:hypothetical protein
VGAVTSLDVLPITRRLLFAAYGFTMYILKFFLPVHLSAFYPYPDLIPGVALPGLFYMMPLFAIAIALIPLFLKKSAGENLYRVSLFGLSFYFFNILFVLQFVSSGGAVMADRYTYLSYYGIVFIILYLVNEALAMKPSLKNPLIGILAAVSIAFSVMCYARTKVWHNPETLWTDVIAKYPGSGSQIAYMNFGDYYAEKGDTANAFKNYKILEDMHTQLPSVYQNLGNIYAMRKQF